MSLPWEAWLEPASPLPPTTSTAPSTTTARAKARGAGSGVRARPLAVLEPQHLGERLPARLRLAADDEDRAVPDDGAVRAARRDRRTGRPRVRRGVVDVDARRSRRGRSARRSPRACPRARPLRGCPSPAAAAPPHSSCPRQGRRRSGGRASRPSCRRRRRGSCRRRRRRRGRRGAREAAPPRSSSRPRRRRREPLPWRRSSWCRSRRSHRCGRRGYTAAGAFRPSPGSVATSSQPSPSSRSTSSTGKPEASVPPSAQTAVPSDAIAWAERPCASAGACSQPASWSPPPQPASSATAATIAAQPADQVRCDARASEGMDRVEETIDLLRHVEDARAGTNVLGAVGRDAENDVVLCA